jgi:GrpB-like predicted nucleotidyltransferase (UPF0157 family)
MEGDWHYCHLRDRTVHPPGLTRRCSGLASLFAERHIVRQNTSGNSRMTRAEAPVEIVAYDPLWPMLFEIEREALSRGLGTWLAGPIEHIGSTAIAGMGAKPVIDIMAAVHTLESSRPAIAAATGLGYCYSPYRPELEHWFCKPSPAFRTHHLHLVPIGSAQWRGALAFRNYLRDHSDVAAEYDALKRRLAQDHQFDREAYTEAKQPFISRVTSVALIEGHSSNGALK